MPEEIQGEVVEINGSKVKAWKDLTDGLFRKIMGAGIIFYSLWFIFKIAIGENAEKDIKLMILTFAFGLISTIAGFYYGSSQPHAKKEEENVEET